MLVELQVIIQVFYFTVVGTTKSEGSRLYPHNKTQLVKRAVFLLLIQRYNPPIALHSAI